MLLLIKMMRLNLVSHVVELMAAYSVAMLYDHFQY